MNQISPPGQASPGAPDPDLDAAIRRLAHSNVLIIGDVMLDRYVHGDVCRVSHEAPVPILSIEREVEMPGGAGNVLRNLTALGAAAAFITRCPMPLSPSISAVERRCSTTRMRGFGLMPPARMRRRARTAASIPARSLRCSTSSTVQV